MRSNEKLKSEAVGTLERTMAELIPLLGEAPILRVTSGLDGCPVAATAVGCIDESVERIWSALTNVEEYPQRVPLINRVRVRGDVAHFDLRFRVAFFSVNFAFESSLRAVEGRSLSLSYRSGEPKDIEIHYLIAPMAGRAGSSALGVHVGFDVMSVGWLARYFLKHHPEIKYGIQTGCALALFDSMRRAASVGAASRLTIDDGLENPLCA